MKNLLCLILVAVMLLALTACGGAAPAETAATAPAHLEDLYAQMEEKLPEMILMDDDMMYNFCGIDPEKCAQAVAAVASNGMQTDEIWLIELNSEEDMDALAELANTRLRMKAEETESYAPDQYAVVQEAKLLRSGPYLALIVTPEAEALAKIVTDAIG